MPPSLHAGLIERRSPRGLATHARPVVPAALVPVAPGSDVSPAPERLSILTAVKPRVMHPPVPSTQPVQAPRTTRRRYGLTVRVPPDTRDALEHLRAQTGATFQQILSTAVSGYLQTHSTDR